MPSVNGAQDDERWGQSAGQQAKATRAAGEREAMGQRKGYSRDPLDDYELPAATVDTVTFQLMDREQARLDKDYKTADSIREQLEEMGVAIDDKARTWRAGPPPKEKALDLNSAAVTAALTLHPEVWISGFGEASEAQLNEAFRAEFPTVTFRMAREKLEDDSDEEDTRFGGGGLESIVMKEAGGGIFDQGGDDTDGPKKVGKGKGFGSIGFRSKKMTAHDRRIKALRAEERARVQGEKDAFATAQQAARASAPVKRVAEPVQRAPTKFQVGLKKRPLPPGNAATAPAATTAGGSSSGSDSDSDDEGDAAGGGGGGGGALGGLLGGYGDSSSSDSSDDEEGGGGSGKRGRPPPAKKPKPASPAPAAGAGNGAAKAFKPTSFVPAAKSKNTLAVEAMRAKMSGDSKTYAELMGRINSGEGATA